MEGLRLALPNRLYLRLLRPLPLIKITHVPFFSTLFFFSITFPTSSTNHSPPLFHPSSQMKRKEKIMLS